MRWDNIFDKKLLKNIDIGIIISMILLFACGIAAIASATGVTHGGSLTQIKIQSVAFILGIIEIWLNIVAFYP